jgi:methyltransferase family protein
MAFDELPAKKIVGSTVVHRHRLLYWDRQSLPGSEEAVELEISMVEFPEPTRFLEHVFDLTSQRATPQVIVSSYRHIRVSLDGGNSWQAFEAPKGAVFTKCFTTRSGRHLLQRDGDGGVHVFDDEWRYLGRREAGMYCWHGTWSIDQSATGTIMFAEYANEGETFRVMTSGDDGEVWHVALQVDGQASAGPRPIRHFHTCQADPFEAGVWWVSSGDVGSQNKLWCSRDDGESWLEITPAYPPNNSDAVLIRRLESLRRHTAEIIKGEWLYWATDDNLGGYARLVRLQRSPEGGALQVLASFTRNEMRNLVSLEADAFAAISEAKHDPKHAQVFYVTTNGTIHARFDLPNDGGSLSGFCRSRSSRAALEDTFFSFSDGHILAPEAAFLKWQLRRASVSESDEARRRLLQRHEAVALANGPNDREASLLKRRYAAHFQCNVCNPALEELFASEDHGAYEGALDPSRFKDPGGMEYPCPHCDSRIRSRTGRVLLSRHIQNHSGRLLAVSESRAEIRRFRQHYESVTHVALHGDFGDPNILGGTDITQMPHIPSGRFNLFWAVVVLDYIPNLTDVAREAYRVLAPGGELAFFIMPFRLVEDNTACVVMHRNALAHEKYAPQGEAETGIPSCRFGVRHILDVFRNAGLGIRRVFVFDQMSRTSQAWFVATKPSVLMPA